jgi:hypothetical protein
MDACTADAAQAGIEGALTVMRDRGLRHWLPTYLAETLHRQRLRSTRARGLTHLLFLVCDHFEPRHGICDEVQPAARLRAWHAGYGDLQEECARRYGLRPLHTWFYPPHHGDEHLAPLARMAYDGLGEVELHYHHDRDTAETLRAALSAALARFHRAGLLQQQGSPPGQRFGFIHGDWALDNSAGGRWCGVNGELSLLKSLGCWGDLTMPSANACQTRKINSIYYAVDRPDRSKSHDHGEDARVGRRDRPGLMLIQGPLGIDLRAPRHPRIENASLTSANWGMPSRIGAWIDCHIHVRGRPEWLFIKLHAHGALEPDFDALFGERARRMHAMLAERYNDGLWFRLHYITARQAFNVIRAAEAGAGGDPESFLDWELPPPVTSLYWTDTPHDLTCCTPERLAISEFFSGTSSTVELRVGGLVQLSGALRALDVRARHATIRLAAQRDPRLGVRLAPGARIRALRGGRVLEETPGGAHLMAAADELGLELEAAGAWASVPSGAQR